MKILHINYSDLVGARFDGFYMIQYNKNVNFDFSMAVWKKLSNNNKVYLLPPKNKIFKFLLEKIFHMAVKLGMDHFVSFFSYYLLSKQSFFKEADIIHLHIIHADTNISYKDLPVLCRHKKVVWTIHDQWAMSGGCTHQFDCKGASNVCLKYCPHPRYNSLFKHIVPYYHFMLKKHYYSKLNLHLIVSTEWMKQQVINSVLLKKFKISVIPFGVDTEVFKNRGKSTLREKLGIPQNNFVVIFRNIGIDNEDRKGLSFIFRALNSNFCQVPITVIMLEREDGKEMISNNFQILTPGWLGNDILIDYISVSDVLLMPSLQETFGLMAIESMSCSVPVIVAEGTSLPEVVKNNIGGIVIKRKSYEDIQNSIILLATDKIFHSTLCKTARERVEQKYNVDQYLYAHEQLYSSL